MLYRICFFGVGVIGNMMIMPNLMVFDKGNQFSMFIKCATGQSASLLIMSSSIMGIFYHQQYMPIICACQTLRIGCALQCISILSRCIL